MKKQLALWLVPAAAALLVTSSPATAGLSFLVDDGSAETSIGVNNGVTGSPFGWANRFTNTTGFVINLQDIQVAFGRIGGPPGDNLIGDAVDAGIWIDAAATGNAANATLAITWTLPGGIHADDGVTFANHAIPGGVNIPVGADFYVGLIDVQSGLDGLIRFPAALDTTASLGRSWAWFNGDVFNPMDKAHTIGTIDSFGLPGNWMIRATGIPAPGALALLGVAGLAGMRRRRRK